MLIWLKNQGTCLLYTSDAADELDGVDLVKSFPTNIYLQNLASIQKRTSLVKFAHLAEKSGKGSISNLSTKVETPVRREGETMTEFAKRAIAAKAMAGRAEATGGSPPKALPYVFF